MILAVDVGNTRIKAAVYEDNMIIADFVFGQNELSEKINFILAAYPKLQHLVVASVGIADHNTFSEFANRISLEYISHESAFPFSNLYATPATLGIDRMILASAAVMEFPGMHRLVIDAGTCITYDFIDNADRYHGGGISPGLQMRYDALHHFTARLPRLTPEEPADFIGGSTSQSMHAGVVTGLVHEVDGFISEYVARYPKIIIILTGGDGVFLAKRLKYTIFANSNFLLRGLAQTFQYKSQND